MLCGADEGGSSAPPSSSVTLPVAASAVAQRCTQRYERVRETLVFMSSR